jgi:hypothetical protein
MTKFKLLLIAALVVGSASIVAISQDTINTEEAAKFLGLQRTVCGNVVSSHHDANLKGQPTFIDLDKPFPYEVFTVLIWESNEGESEKAPQEMYAGKEVCVTGLIKRYHGHPLIEVDQPSQIIER